MFGTPYVFYRYKIVEDDVLLTTADQWELLTENVGRMVAYRRSNPTPRDMDTYLIMPDHYSVVHPKSREELTIHFFNVAKHITSRKTHKYEQDKNDLVKIEVSADEDIFGSVVTIPRLGLLAASDRTGNDYLNAKSTVARFATIIRSIPSIAMQFELASSLEDLGTAVKNWSLDEFSFTAKPYNPTVRVPGDKMHELLEPDNAKVIGRAKANKGEKLVYSDEGLINEITGLAERGYAEYGAKGKTAQGYFAMIEKANPYKNKAPKIRVFVPEKTRRELNAQAVASVLLDIDG